MDNTQPTPNAYEARQEARRERYEARAAKARREADALANRSLEMSRAIPLGQPILTDHYSAKADRRYRDRMNRLMGKSVEATRKAEHYDDKAAGVGTAGVSGDDPQAVEKLREQLRSMKEDQERMKAANRAIRKHAKDGEDAQIAALMKLGHSEAEAREVVAPDYCGRVGHPRYELSNNNANMRRIAKRIEELEAVAKLTTAERVCDGFTYREDVEENRVMFIFPGKPDEDTRQQLKRAAFKWSRSRGAWVRQMTANGIHAGRRLMRALSANKDDGHAAAR